MASLLYHIYQQEEEHESNTGMVQYLQHQEWHCHSERSEESGSMDSEILSEAKNDN